jgi:hypothetical protein
MQKPLFIQLVADYGVGDGAFGEVTQKLMLLTNSSAIVHQTSVPAFSTIATGFWTAQYSVVNPILDGIIYTNTAPRKDTKASRDKNEGERLVFAKLNNGVKIVGVNAGYCFSFVKPHIASLHVVNVANKGSQFRSRDFYPEAVIGIAKSETKFIGEKISKDTIPDAPAHAIAWIDGYGNIKTTTRQSQILSTKPKLVSGQPLTIFLNGIKRTAFFTDGTFSVREGELAFAPGSSGGEDRFMEIFLRGLSAWREFGKPKVEQTFTIEAD